MLDAGTEMKADAEFFVTRGMVDRVTYEIIGYDPKTENVLDLAHQICLLVVRELSETGNLLDRIPAGTEST